MALLKWLGETSVTFNDLPGTGLINPGDEFEAPDSQVERYIRRSDIELAKPVNDSAKSAKAGT